MCGRYNIISDSQALIDGFSIMILSLDANRLEPQQECFPGEMLPVIRHTDAGRELTLMRWGLIPSWSKTEKPKFSTINAKAETLQEKPTYRLPFQRRRCVIPATGFYEWQGPKGAKTKYLVQKPQAELFAFAGLWDRWQGEHETIESFTIITTSPNREMSEIHERMPVIFDPDQVTQWLDPQADNLQQLQVMLAPYQDGALEVIAS